MTTLPSRVAELAANDHGSQCEATGVAFAVPRRVDDGQHAPKQVRLDFDVDLDDSTVQTISERESGFEEVALPAVNFGVRLVQ